MKCIGFGEYEGLCVNKAGSPWSSQWCKRCDKIRLKQIGDQFDALINRLKKEEDEEC